MKSLKLTAVTATLCLALMGTAQAGHHEKMTDKAKDVVMDKAGDMAKDAMGSMSSEDKMEMGKKMLLEGKTAEEAATEMAMDKAKDKAKTMASDTLGHNLGDAKIVTDTMDSGKMDSGKMDSGKSQGMMDTAMDAGKKMMNGQSAKDAVMQTGKDKAMSMAKDKAMGMATGAIGQGKEGVMTTPTMETVTPAPAPAQVITCPAGTTAQPNGTCMVTGDYDVGQF